MDISNEEITAKLNAEQPDLKICVHDVRGRAFRVVEENGFVGVMFRIIGHDRDNKVVSIDLMCDPDSAVQMFDASISAVPTMAAYDKNGDSLEKLTLAMLGSIPVGEN